MENKIKDISSSFSFDRFHLLTKADLLINKGYYIKLVIAVIGIFAAIAFFLSLNAGLSIHSTSQPIEFAEQVDAISSKQVTHGSTYAVISLWVISIGLTILGSLTFSNFSSKKSRIAALMVPASRIEKFTLRLLTYLVGGAILLFIGFLVGAGICQLAFGAWMAIFNEIKEFFNLEFASFIAAYGVLIALLGNSIYALGSSIWPKLSWIKTWAVLAVAQWVFSTIMMVLFSQDLSWINFFRFWENNINSIKWIGLTVLAILNIACWILSWWRYKNTQIIQRFMTK